MRRKNDINVKECIRDWQENKNIESRDKVFFRYKNTVDSCVERIIQSTNLHDFSKEDLKQEGYLELLNIISTIDVESGYALAKIIYIKIKAKILNILRDNYGIIVPARFCDMVNSKDFDINSLSDSSKDFDTELIGKLINSFSNIEHIGYIEDWDNFEDISNAQYEEDFLACVDINCLKDVVAYVLSTLTPRQGKVISLRFGLEGNDELTLVEVGKYLNICKDSVRRIEAMALRRLRHYDRSKLLKDFLVY